MNYTLIKKILPLMEAYEENNTSNSLTDFVIWLNNRLFAAQANDEHHDHGELVAAFKLMYVNKALKKEAKQVLSQSAISSIDEYSFLLHLQHQESFRKMEIIELHNLEAPTGIEIIKRLLKNGFIEEFADEDDKRAKRIKLTATGMNELNGLKPAIDAVFMGFTEPLNMNEKIQFIGVLDKLIQG